MLTWSLNDRDLEAENHCIYWYLVQEQQIKAVMPDRSTLAPFSITRQTPVVNDSYAKLYNSGSDEFEMIELDEAFRIL